MDELRSDVEEASRQLGKVKDDLYEILRQKTEAEGQLDQVKRKLQSVRADLSATEGLVARESKEYERIVTEQNSYISNAEAKIKSLSKISDDLDKKISIMKKEEERLKIISNDVLALENRATALDSKITKMMSDFSSLKSDKEKEVSQLEQKRRDLRDESKKNGKILSEVNANIDRIRIYAKRLQRHYDRAGIKFDVLTSFNIPNENAKN